MDGVEWSFEKWWWCAAVAAAAVNPICCWSCRDVLGAAVACRVLLWRRWVYSDLLVVPVRRLHFVTSLPSFPAIILILT